MEDLDAEEVEVETKARMACVRGSRKDVPPLKSWMRVWCKVWNIPFEVYNLKSDACIVENCDEYGMVGGHVWLRGESKEWDKTHCYIGPMCNAHNIKLEYQLPKGFYTKPGIRLVRILPHACYVD
jgi:hypothetical protein